MAASQAQEPQNVPLPNTPLKAAKSTSKNDKGKAKEQVSSHQKRRTGLQTPASTTPDGDLDWDWISLTEPAPVRAPPIFTQDGSYFFVLVGSSVKIYSSSTGIIISTLSTPRISHRKCSSDLTSVIIHPHNAFQLITGSLDGCLRVWNFLDGVLLRTIDIGQPILHLCGHTKFKDAVFIAARKSITKMSDSSVVMRVSLRTMEQSSLTKSSEITAIGKARSPTGLALSASGAFLVMTGGHTAYVADTSQLQSGFTKFVSPERLTCLAVHPSEEYFATGDDKGVVRLWYCLDESVGAKIIGLEKKTQTATLHWHAHAVASLQFAPNGGYLLSGGEEAVLVIWQLHSRKREFIPRVGAPIHSVSIRRADTEEEYLLGLADSTYIFIAASTLKVSRSFSRIKLDPMHNHTHQGKILAAPLAVHHRESTLILPSSHPSSLQTYAPSSSKLLSELEVSPSNRVSRRDDKPIQPTYVQTVVVSPSGEWMATLDVRDSNETFQGEIYLKLWQWDRASRNWNLNSRIDQPHGTDSINHADFSPDSNILVTVGADGFAKTWRLRPPRRNNGAAFWSPRSSSTFRSQKPTHASWSQDGSLLAISNGPYVAIYDKASIHYRTLSLPNGDAILSAHFVGQEGRLLAACGVQHLVLWDVVSQNAIWHYQATRPISALIAHPQSDSFALFQPESQTETRILLFHSSSRTPRKSVRVPFGLLNVKWYSDSSNSPPSAFSFVGITRDWRVVMFGDGVSEIEASGLTPLVDPAGPQRRTLFQDIFGQSAFTQAATELTSSEAFIGFQTRPDVLFDGPSIAMPPIEDLFEGVLASLLTSSRSNPHLIPSSPSIQYDVEMEDDTQPTTRSRRAPAASTFSVTQRETNMLLNIFKKSGSNRADQLEHPTPNGAIEPIPPQVNGPTVSPGKPSKRTKGKKHAALPVTPSPSPPPRPRSSNVMANGSKQSSH